MSMEEHYFECDCYSPEHLLQFKLFDTIGEDHKTLSAYVFLNPEPWYKRIWIAVKYIFGYKCRYGHFDEFILNPEDVDKFINLLNKLKE